MNEMFAKVKEIGELFYSRVYLYYDEPLIFSCISKTFQRYLVEKVPAKEGMEAWVLTTISEAKLNKLEKNIIDIRSAFSDPETNRLILLRRKNSIYYVRFIEPIQLGDSMLPEKNVFLQCNTNPSDVLFTSGVNPICTTESKKTHVNSILWERAHPRKLGSSIA